MHLILALLLLAHACYAFMAKPKLTHLQHTHPTTKRYLTTIDSSVLIAVGDYAAEIEKTVGTEVYTPIFRAGLFLFISGLISAFIAAFIISKANSWDDIYAEFERGKESKLIESELSPLKEKKTQPEEPSSSSSEVLQEVKDLDL